MKKLLFFILIGSFITACYDEGEREFRTDELEFKTLGEWETSGRPNYLCERASELNPSLVNNFLSTFISRQNAIETHPDLFDSSASNVSFTANTDMTISFLFEEASNSNVMGYFVYPTNQPPTSPNDIKDYVILFPNVRTDADGSGQTGLVRGDKICIDGLSAGTSMGFFVVVNGWKNNELSIGRGHPFIFSFPDFNKVEGADELQQKSLLLHDEASGNLVITFEALAGSASDNDYEDAALVLQLSNPSAVNTSQIIKLPSSGS